VSYVLKVLEFAMPPPPSDAVVTAKIISSDTEEDRKAWRMKIKAKLVNKANRTFIRRDDRSHGYQKHYPRSS
jgi:hypothetical protein